MLGLLEKFDVLWIGPRPAALNVMDAEGIEFFGNTQLIQDGKVDAFALAAVAQGRIVYFDFGFHNSAAGGGVETNTTTAGLLQNIKGPVTGRGRVRFVCTHSRRWN